MPGAVCMTQTVTPPSPTRTPINWPSWRRSSASARRRRKPPPRSPRGKKGAKGESSLPESPSPQEETKGDPRFHPLTRPPLPTPPRLNLLREEVEETFVEESFLEEAEEDQNEKK